jgi:MFS family permease
MRQSDDVAGTRSTPGARFDRARFDRGTWAALLVLGLGFGALFGGIVGALIAAVGIAIVAWRGPRWVVGCSLACLLVAAVATVTEASLSAEYDDFGHGRPIAAEMARAAGILAMVAVIAFARRERRQPDAP